MKYRYRTDDEMKDSGVEWLGKIPKEWEVLHLRKILKGQIVDGPHETPEYVEEGIPFISVDSLSESENVNIDIVKKFISKEKYHEYNKKTDLKKNDILFSKSATIGKVAIVDERIFMTWSPLAILKVNNEKSYFKNLFYILKSNRYVDYIKSLSSLNTQLNIGMKVMEKSKIAVSKNIIEQQKIALFLDKKTAEFDNIIEKKQSFITKLTEAKKSLISEVVTGKVKVQVIDNKYQVISRADDEMKDSGVEWLGKIPREWEVKRLKHYIKDLESGVSVNASESESAIENEIGVLKTSCVVNYTFNAHENKKVLENEINRVNCPVKKGMIIISRMNTPELVGASGYVEEDYPNLFLPDRLWQTIFNKENIINIRLLSYILLSERFKNSITTIATGTSSSMKNISKGNFLNLSISVSNLQEQQLIVSFLDEKTAKIDSTIEKINLQIEKLKGAKQSLISEAVTGKIEVI